MIITYFLFLKRLQTKLIQSRFLSTYLHLLLSELGPQSHALPSIKLRQLIPGLDQTTSNWHPWQKGKMGLHP